MLKSFLPTSIRPTDIGFSVYDRTDGKTILHDMSLIDIMNRLICSGTTNEHHELELYFNRYESIEYLSKGQEVKLGTLTDYRLSYDDFAQEIGEELIEYDAKITDIQRLGYLNQNNIQTYLVSMIIKNLNEVKFRQLIFDSQGFRIEKNLERNETTKFWFRR